MQIFSVEIKNWEKYNPRNDVKKFSWFRFDANFFTDPVISCLNNNQVVALLVLFTERCKATCSKFKLSLRLPSFFCKMSEDEFLACLNAFQDMGIIDFSEIRPDPARSDRTRPDPCSTNDTYDTNETIRTPPEPTTRSGPRTPPLAKPKKVLAIVDLGPEWYQLGTDWLNFGLKQMPWQSKQAKWNAYDFGIELKRIGAIMGIDHTGMRVVFDKAIQDDFWNRHIASPFGLMGKSKNGNRKIDNLLNSFKTKADREREVLADFANSGYIAQPTSFD